MNSSSKPDGTILLHAQNFLNSAALFKALLFGILRNYEKLDQMHSTPLFLNALIINLKATFMFKDLKFLRSLSSEHQLLKNKGHVWRVIQFRYLILDSVTRRQASAFTSVGWEVPAPSVLSKNRKDSGK